MGGGSISVCVCAVSAQMEEEIVLECVTFYSNPILRLYNLFTFLDYTYHMSYIIDMLEKPKNRQKNILIA